MGARPSAGGSRWSVGLLPGSVVGRGCARSRLGLPAAVPVLLLRSPLVGSPPLPLVFSLAVGVCAARPVLLVPAPGRLSLLSLLAVSFPGFLVRGLASRCVWLPLPGPGAVRCLFLPGLPLARLLRAESPLSLWLPLLGSALPCPFPLLLSLLGLLLSFPRPGAPVSLPLARCALLPRARGAAPPPAFRGGASRVPCSCRVCWLLLLSRRRRSRGRAFRALRWSSCGPAAAASSPAGLPGVPSARADALASAGVPPGALAVAAALPSKVTGILQKRPGFRSAGGWIRPG